MLDVTQLLVDPIVQLLDSGRRPASWRVRERCLPRGAGSHMCNSLVDNHRCDRHRIVPQCGRRSVDQAAAYRCCSEHHAGLHTTGQLAKVNGGTGRKQVSRRRAARNYSKISVPQCLQFLCRAVCGCVRQHQVALMMVGEGQHVRQLPGCFPGNDRYVVRPEIRPGNGRTLGIKIGQQRDLASPLRSYSPVGAQCGLSGSAVLRDKGDNIHAHIFYSKRSMYMPVHQNTEITAKPAWKLTKISI